MTELIDELLNYKKQAQTAQSEADQIKGSIKNDMEQLKKLGCNDIEEANKKIETLDKEINEKEQTFQVGVENIRTQYSWNN